MISTILPTVLARETRRTLISPYALLSSLRRKQMFGKKFGSHHNNNIGQWQRFTDNNNHSDTGHIAGGGGNHGDGSNKQRHNSDNDNNSNNNKRSRDKSRQWKYTRTRCRRCCSGSSSV